MKKVVLLNPPMLELREPLAYAPLSLLILGAILEQNKIDVEIINLAGTEFEDVSALIPEADLYGITTVTPTFNSSKKLVDIIKKKYKEAIVIMGGVHPTLEPEWTLNNTNTDFVAIGEWEKTLQELIDNDFTFYRLQRGIAYRSGTNIINNGYGEPLRNLDDSPLPAYHLLPPNQVYHRGGLHTQVYKGDGRSACVYSSVGCPYKCSFCSKPDFLKKVRFKSVEKFVQELKFLRDNYGIYHFRFCDDIFTIRRNRIEEFCKQVKSLGIYFHFATRANLVDRDMLKILYEAGAREIAFGVESGSQKILDKVDKHVDVEINKWAIKIAKEIGLKVKLLLIFGLPGETKETIRETKQFMIDTKPDFYSMSTFSILPGSPIWKNPEKYGTRILNKDTDNYWFYFEPGDHSGFCIEYTNATELYEERDKMIVWLRSGVWRKLKKSV